MIKLESLTKVFRLGKKTITAVNNVSLQIQKGEIVGLVGESGCGKSTLAKLLMRLEKPSFGRMHFEGNDITHSKDRALCRQMQMIFQDPFASLNPRMTVEDIIAEPLYIHGLPYKKEVTELLDLVGLPENAKYRFPHEFSGGQRQRIGIARALALKPKFLVCDEPISALDVSIQAQIVSLLQRLQKELSLTYLFIAHDLAMIRHVSDRIAVMYLGRIVEIAPADELFATPCHPYTQLLLASVPIPDPVLERARPKFPIFGEPPSLLHTIEGCPFQSRCPRAEAICKETRPPLIQVGSTHFAACHFAKTFAEKTEPNQ